MEENYNQKIVTPPSPDIAKWQMDIEDIIRRVELWLEGKDIITKLKKDENGNVIGQYNDIVQVSKPLANKNFITLVKNIMQLYIRKDILFSNLTTDNVGMYAETLGKNIMTEIYLGYENYGIDIKDIPTIVFGITDMVHASLSQAINGGTRETFRSIVKQSTTVSDENKKKGGFLGIFG